MQKYITKQDNNNLLCRLHENLGCVDKVITLYVCNHAKSTHHGFNDYLCTLNPHTLMFFTRIFVLFFPVITLMGQSKTSDYQTTIEGGFMAGGKASHRTIVFRSGPELSGSFQKQFYKRLHLGFGMGVIGMEDELFIPLFVDLRHKLSEGDNGLYLGFRTGYAFGANATATSVENTIYQGGWHARTSIGYQSKMSTSFAMQFGFNISHQQGVLDRRFQTSQINHRERLRFFLFSFSVGLIFL